MEVTERLRQLLGSPPVPSRTLGGFCDGLLQTFENCRAGLSDAQAQTGGAEEVQKKSELEGKRALWNRQLEDAGGEAGRIRNEADAYYQTRTNEAKALIAVAQAEAEGVRKEAQALGKLGGEAYVKMQVAQQLSHKRVTIVPGTNVSTLDVNKLVDYLVAKKPKEEE